MRRVRRRGQQHARQHRAPRAAARARRCGRSARPGRDVGRSAAGHARAAGAVGRMAEASAGKDSVTGHWEMMGIVLDRPFPVFPDGFPAGRHRGVRAADRPRRARQQGGVGHAIIDELGAEHMRTGALIVYTSADSVFQIAAHEDVVPVAGAVPRVRDRLRAGRRGPGRRPRHRAAVRRRARALQADREPPRLRAAAVRRDAARSPDRPRRCRSSRSARSRICSPAAASRAPCTRRATTRGWTRSSGRWPTSSAG